MKIIIKDVKIPKSLFYFLKGVPYYSSHNRIFFVFMDHSRYSADREYITHNSAKATWYGIESLDGISPDNISGITVLIKKFLSCRKFENLSTDDMFPINYEGW